MVKGDKEKPEENGGDDETMDSNILKIIRQCTCEPVEDPGAGKDSEKKRGDDEVMGGDDRWSCCHSLRVPYQYDQYPKSLLGELLTVRDVCEA